MKSFVCFSTIIVHILFYYDSVSDIYKAYKTLYQINSVLYSIFMYRQNIYVKYM